MGYRSEARRFHPAIVLDKIAQFLTAGLRFEVGKVLQGVQFNAKG